MATDSPDLVIAKRLLDHAKARGFQFQRVAEGPDGALLGTRHAGDYTDTLYLDGFSRDCYALRERWLPRTPPDHHAHVVTCVRWPRHVRGGHVMCAIGRSERPERLTQPVGHRPKRASSAQVQRTFELVDG